MSNQNEHSDQLFERLEKEKKMRRRRIVRTVLIVIVAVIILGIMAVSSLRKKVEERFGSFDAEVLAYEVKTGTINTVVSGSGTLTEDDLEQVKVPAGVEIMEIIPERNDAVSKGDVLATVDMASVMTALAEIQTELDELDEQIQAAAKDWTIERMPRVDLTILRLATWEILHEEDVPGSVAINEAVELAARYSEPASGRFINGVLGTILRRKEAA